MDQIVCQLRTWVLALLKLPISPWFSRTSLVNRRQILRGMAAAAGCAVLPPWAAIAGRGAAVGQTALGGNSRLSREDEEFLDELERQGCLFFWEQASERTGQVLDRARQDLGGARDRRRMASIASTGFGLTALAIADQRGYLPHEQVLERVRTTLEWHLDSMPEVHGFFYHFTDLETGARWRDVELSSIDTSILLCGILTAKAHFNDEKITALAEQIYERVDWTWLLNGGSTFSMGWKPETGFLTARWEHYSELMMIYLLAMGSRTHSVSAELWHNFKRPVIRFAGYEFISGNDPIFTHQYSQAWFDFRERRDEYADYFENSVKATKAHRAFCLSQPQWYSEDYWGVTASDSMHGYVIWGGPPAMGPLDGTVVPSAAAGSLVFMPEECLAVLRAMRAKWGSRAWGRYGFADAFHPAKNWYDPDVIGIDQGISVLMAENLRSGMVWRALMSNRECGQAMELAGFKMESPAGRRKAGVLVAAR